MLDAGGGAGAGAGAGASAPGAECGGVVAVEPGAPIEGVTFALERDGWNANTAAPIAATASTAARMPTERVRDAGRRSAFDADRRDTCDTCEPVEVDAPLPVAGAADGGAALDEAAGAAAAASARAPC